MADENVLKQAAGTLGKRPILGLPKKSAAIPDAPKQNAAEAQAALLNKMIGEVNAEIEQSSKQREVFGAELDKSMQHMHDVMQRQRFITLNRGIEFKKFLPIAAAFALIGGHLAGTLGALKSVAGSLAGYAQGKLQDYNEAQKKWKAEMQSSIESAELLQKGMQDILDDTHTEINEKLQLIQAITYGKPFFKGKTGNYQDAVSATEKHREVLEKFRSAAKRAEKALGDPTPSEVKNAQATIANTYPPPVKPSLYAKPEELENYNRAKSEWDIKTHAMAVQLASAANVYQAKNENTPYNTAIQRSFATMQAHGMVQAAPQKTALTDAQRGLLERAKAVIQAHPDMDASALLAHLREQGLTDAELKEYGLE